MIVVHEVANLPDVLPVLVHLKTHGANHLPAAENGEVVFRPGLPLLPVLPEKVSLFRDALWLDREVDEIGVVEDFHEPACVGHPLGSYLNAFHNSS